VTRIWAALSSVQFSAGARDFSVLRNVQIGSGVCLALCSLGAGGCFAVGTVMGA
jgi:hypothetical protein